LFGRGILAPLNIWGRERWTSGGNEVQRNDLSYRLARATIGAGFVFPSGLEPHLGFWYSEGKQTRKNFDPPLGSFNTDLVSVERGHEPGPGGGASRSLL
jgi:hypothetical protein